MMERIFKPLMETVKLAPQLRSCCERPSHHSCLIEWVLIPKVPSHLKGLLETSVLG